MARNVISVKGGKIHLPLHLEDQEQNDRAFPFCRTGGMTNSGTKYRFTDGKATCTTCLGYFAPATAVKAPETAEGLVIESEPAPIPDNWLYMAKHANTPSGRAWWCKKCGITDQEN